MTLHLNPRPRVCSRGTITATAVTTRGRNLAEWEPSVTLRHVKKMLRVCLSPNRFESRSTKPEVFGAPGQQELGTCAYSEGAAAKEGNRLAVA